MKSIAVLGILFFANLVFAQSYTLRDNNSGQTFYCSPNSDGGGNGSTNPRCTQEVADYCSRTTTYTSNTCFTKASQSCAGANANYSSCVTQTTDYCDRTTSNTSTQCFDLALGSCRGSASSMQKLLENVRIESAERVLK